MSPPDGSPSASANVPLISLDDLLLAISDANRWRILGELANGDAVMVNELAQRIGRSDTATSKHLAVLRDTGLVEVNRRLYKIPERFLADREQRHIETGHCLLRLKAAE